VARRAAGGARRDRRRVRRAVALPADRPWGGGSARRHLLPHTRRRFPEPRLLLAHAPQAGPERSGAETPAARDDAAHRRTGDAESLRALDRRAARPVAGAAI